MDIFTNIFTTEEAKPTTKNFYDPNVSFHDISEQTRNIIENVCFAGVLLPICLVGIPSNIINCVVFWKQGLGDRMNLCLFCLAASDCLRLLCSFTMSPVTFFIRLYNHNFGEEYYLKTMVTLSGLLHGFRFYSGVIGVVISVETCLCVVLPLRAPNLIRTRTMRIILFLSFFLIQSCYVLHPLSSQAVLKSQNNLTFWYMESTTFYKENINLVETLDSKILDIFITIGTFTVVAGATTVTVIRLKLAMKWRQQATSNNLNPHTALTSMLIAVSIIYIATMTPFVVWQVTYCFLPHLLHDAYNMHNAFKVVSHTIPAIDSSVHIFIYYYRSSRFRSVFRRLFLKDL